MPKPKSETAGATLTLTITYEQARLTDILDAAREVIEKATEQGAAEGYLDIHRTGRIPVDDLR